MSHPVSAKEVLSLVDCSLLDQVAEETAVDFQVKKLKGAVIFKLLLLTLLDQNKMSLRVMEQMYNSSRFKQMAHMQPASTTKFNSLSDRLASIEVGFFEKMFEQLFSLLQNRITDQEQKRFHLRPFDTTTVSASATLLSLGMVTGARDKEGRHRLRQIKFGIGLWEGLPCEVRLFSEQKHLGEDITLRELLLKSTFAANDIALFDAGLKKREAFAELSERGIFFVTRINPTTAFEVLQDYVAQHSEDWQSDTLQIHSDQQVYLFSGEGKVEVPFRLIRSTILKTGEPLFLLTNIERLADNQWISAAQIAEIYRNRWEIEVFFKLLKQHLHLKHFCSYSENGIKVMMYMSLIAATLLLWYRKQNQMKSDMMARLAFIEELDRELIKEIVVICGGDPSKSPILSSA